MNKVSSRNAKRIFIHAAITLAGFVVPTDGIAAYMDYSIGMEAVYSDNLTLTSDPGNKVSDLNRKAFLGGMLTQDSARVNANISSLIEYSDYRDDTYADEAWFNLNGNVDFTIRPRSFFWKVEDYYSQQKRVSFEPETPDNLINTNAFSTGPDLFFRLNPASRLNLGSRVSDYRFEGTNADSQRATVNLAWLFKLSRIAELSMNAVYQKAKFEELDDADFNRQDLFMRYDVQPSRSSFQFDIGATNIDREYHEDVTGFLARMGWRNQFRGQAFFQLDVSSQYTDSGIDLLSLGSQGTAFDRSGVQVSGDVFYDRRVEGSYNLSSGVWGYNINMLYRDEDYEIIAQDRQTQGLNIGLHHVYSVTTNIAAELQYRKYDNIDIDRIDRERSAAITMNYRLTRDYTCRLEYHLNTLDSNIPGGEYDENRILFSFFYGRDPGSYR